MTTYWFLDFDDTLASGPTTWGLKHALPKLIRQNQLSFDGERYQRAVLATQEQVAGSRDILPALNGLFDEMGWPHSLQAQLLEDLRTGYQPEFFSDALPFLQRLQEKQKQVYIISNNPRSPLLVEQMGISQYIQRCFTPDVCTGARPKPDATLWNCVLSAGIGADVSNSVMIGDDPWSDGTFAENCGLTCWIVDRGNRFASDRYPVVSYRRAQSLLDIPV